MAELPNKLAKVWLKEQKLGYMNAAVVGGFSQWLEGFAANLPEPYAKAFKLAAEAYRKGTPAEREELWQQSYMLLSSLTPEQLKNTTEASQKAVSENKTYVRAELRQSVQYLKGVGPKKAALLRNLDIYTVNDLLYHFPRLYEDRGNVIPISQTEIGVHAVVCGRILNSSLRQVNARLHILNVLVGDDTDNITAVWFNQKHLAPKMEYGKTIMLYGKIERKYGTKEIMVLDYLFVQDQEEAKAVERLIPVYPSTGNFSQKSFRSLLKELWLKYQIYLTEDLPEELLVKHKLMGLKDAMAAMHFPKTMLEQEEARRRLAYEELLVLQMAVLANRIPESVIGIKRPVTPSLLAEFGKFLAFELTAAQKRVIEEIFVDMESVKPMARLVQGDVGSGKTMVAAAALYKNALSGYQGALMAPTEILARQHYENLLPLFKKSKLETALFTGDLSGKAREALLEKLKNGEIGIIIGTHTLIQKQVHFAKLGLAVTDEQHRFGVMQRQAISQKGNYPDILVMTATPIPRTLALTVYGDLNLSVIDEMPPNRKQIETYAVAYDKEKRVFDFIKKALLRGEQAYIVCPLVEESAKLSLEAAVSLAKRLAQGEFKGFKVALLHGKLKAAEKEALMNDFAAGKVQVLVSTTVIEVGIDVPNATIMLVRDAERFGLAQLHQLRGRVGRGELKSYCILMHNSLNHIAYKRLQTMCKTNDGFEIAEMDLELRGPGEIFGTRQHGLPEMRVANLAKDGRLMELARADAMRFLQSPNWQSTALGIRVKQNWDLLKA